MGKLISVERSEFVNRNIDIYAQNKVGQYSKFLDKTPIFVTYYSINSAQSRADVGTGGIQSDIGADSPIRYNQIKEFPIYNMPELKPDLNYDETGMDIELEPSDITILPGTVKPVPGDMFLVSFPGIQDFLFTINNIRYNTIQSNDFYMCDAHLRSTGDKIADMVKPQIVEKYHCIFENIGTQDKCFLKDSEIDEVNTIVKAFEELRDIYHNKYYNRVANGMLYPKCRNLQVFMYDPYLEAFINKSHIFYEENSEYALVLTPLDLLDPEFNYIFSRSLWNAVLTRSERQLAQWEYCYETEVQKNNSPLIICDIPTLTRHVVIARKELPTSEDIVINAEVIDALPHCVDTNLLGNHPYFRKDFMETICAGAGKDLDLFETIIYNYLKHINTKIDVEQMMGYILDEDPLKVFYLLPMVLYILTQYYKEYFYKDKDYQI